MRRLEQAALVVLLVLVVVGGFAGSARSSAASTRRLASSSNSALLERLAPTSASTWWAIVESNSVVKTWVVRTSNSGRRWQAVTPPVRLVSSSAFLGRNVAWIEADSLHFGAPGAPRSEPVYRTLDGGRSWQRLSRVAGECQLDFVNRRDGWCTINGAAAGSASVWIYRTRNGGSSWALVSRTAVPGQGVTTPGALPFGCDKTFAFTSPRIGWAALICAGGESPLYMSRDGGARWHKLSAVPLPKHVRLGGGTEMSLPAVHGPQLALSLVGPATASGHGGTVIATSANRGRSWRTRIAPGEPGYGSVDFVDVRHWVLSNGSTLLATSDAGRHWHSMHASARFVNTLGTPLTPNFLSPRLGFAVSTNAEPTAIWWTHNAGTTWKQVKITAGPYTLG